MNQSFLWKMQGCYRISLKYFFKDYHIWWTISLLHQIDVNSNKIKSINFPYLDSKKKIAYVFICFSKKISRLKHAFIWSFHFLKSKFQMNLHDNIELKSNRNCSNIIGKQYNDTEEFVIELQVNDCFLSIVLPRNFSQDTRKVVRKVITRELTRDVLLQFARNKFWFRSFFERDKHAVTSCEQTK